MDDQMSMMWMLARMRFGCQTLEYYGLQNSFRASLSAVPTALWRSKGTWDVEGCVACGGAPTPLRPHTCAPRS